MIPPSKEIDLKFFENTPNLTATVKDCRNSNHPELGNFDSLEDHIKKAVDNESLRFHKPAFLDSLIAGKKKMRKVNFLKKYLMLAGEAKGIRRFSKEHGKSSFSRYQNHEYETLDLLKRNILIKHKNEIYEGYSGLLRLEIANSIIKLCKGIENPKILETGCGAGNTIFIINCLNPNIQIDGFEYTNARLASALINLYSVNHNGSLFLADVTSMNIESESYDLVYSHHVLEQLGQEGAEKAVNEMWRVCKTGIVLSEPSIHGATSYEKWRMTKLGYCRDLLKIAKTLPNATIEVHQEGDYRTYPNTSYHLIVKKNK